VAQNDIPADQFSSYFNKQNSNVTVNNGAAPNNLPAYSGRPSTSHVNGHVPFEMISDDDLLGSNFDRMSKILPAQEHLDSE